MISEFIVKVSEAGGVYIRIRSDTNEASKLTIKAIFSLNKISSTNIKPGNKGNMEYSLIDSKKAQLTFSGLVCTSNDKNCAKDYSFFALSSNNMEDVFAQLVCSSIMFDLSNATQTKAVETPIAKMSSKDSQMSFTH